MSTTGIAGTVPLVRVEVVRGIRSPRFLLLGIGLPLAIYVAYTVTGLGGSSDRAIGGVAWHSYFMVSMAAFGAMNAALGVAAARRREAPGAARSVAANGDLAGTSKVVVRAVSAMVLAVPSILLLGLAGALAGVHLADVEWYGVAISLWLGVLPFVALGLLLGPILDADTGDVILAGGLVLLAIVGGFFQPVDTFPSGLAALAHVLPSYRLADLGWTTIAGRAGDPVDVLVLAGYAVACGVIIIWRKRIEDARVGD